MYETRERPERPDHPRERATPETPNRDTPALVASALDNSAAGVENVAPNILSLAHRTRILDGELYAKSARLDWRTLLKRTFEVDLRACVTCGGKPSVRAVITEPETAAKFLRALARTRQRAPPVVAP